jgi:Protein of unknown function (DUF2442)/Ribbon-helix-helix protein, copG family
MLKASETAIQIAVPAEIDEALKKLADLEGMASVEELIRRLIANYCQGNGFDVDASLLKSQEESLRAVEARIADDRLYVTLADGRVIGTPLAWYPWLANATPGQRDNVQLGAIFLYWPDLDEGLSIDGMLKGPAR